MNQTKPESKPYRLIFINHYASIPKFPGPTRNFDFAAVLAGLGWSVNLVSCRFNHYLRRYLPEPPKSERRVRLRWIWSTPYHGNTLERELNILVFSKLSFWANLFTPADIVVTVTPPLESAFFGWLLAKVKRVPFVLDLEDLWPDSIITMGFHNKPVIRWLRFLERFLYRHSDHIMAVAGEMKEYLLKQGVPASKIDLIPLGANIPVLTGDREALRAKWGFGKDEIVAVYVGAHGPANALETLLRAAVELKGTPGIRIVLFGDGSDKPRLQKLYLALELRGNLTLADPVPPEQVPEILQAADIGIASLKDTETFKTVRPNKIYEYMAVGLPIICCIDGEARKIVAEAGAGIPVMPEDSWGLAQVLQTLAGDAEERRRFGENGLKYVRRTGDRVELAGQMDQVLKKVIHDHRSF
jgi:glycosyltransferase involved in cell wall biosynthesis